MAASEVETHCYNKGCGKKYFPSENSEESCVFHPGGPIFHDAYKSWSCCNKRTTDFTEFLNTKGCTKGLHSNQKPPEKAKVVPATKQEIQEVIVVKAPRPAQPTERPSASSPLVSLPVNVGASLKAAIANLKVSTPEVKQDQDVVSNDIKEGTSCKNTGCQETYKGVESKLEMCKYHSGKAIFHEGMKYWSCCQRKTSDFNNFLEQEGCTSGEHLWLLKEDNKRLVECRYDWHQTGSQVVLSVYCKNSQPDMSSVKANPVLLDVNISFNQTKNQFKKTIHLYGVIDPARSSMTMLGSKCEIKLKKADACAWKKFELPPPTDALPSNDESKKH